jgi:hypothetical protein
MLGLKPVILPVKLNHNSNPANEVLELYVSEIVSEYIFLAIGICFYYDFQKAFDFMVRSDKAEDEIA